MELELVQTTLRHAEEAIERAARNAFTESGAQFKHIRDNRLYIAFRPGVTWEDYTLERWEMTPQRAGQLISAFEITEQLKLVKPLVSESETNGFIFPTSETHVRPLAKLKAPEERAEVWQRVAGSGRNITAKLVEAEVERFEAEQNKNWITLSEWEQLPEDERTRRLSQFFGHDKTFNSQDNDNIEWANWSWNPVTGCLHDCEYCYARDIAARFYPQLFAPSILPERLNMPYKTKLPNLDRILDPVQRMAAQNVFTCSMADLFGKWVPSEWIEAVLEQVRNNPQWNFLFLTKFPIRMSEFDYPANAWLGTTVDKQWAVQRAEKGFTKLRENGYEGVAWLSCEPMLERLTFDRLDMFDWLVVGGGSKSTQTPETRPEFEWIAHIWQQAKAFGLPVYMKTNLGIEQRVREYPKFV